MKVCVLHWNITLLSSERTIDKKEIPEIISSTLPEKLKAVLKNDVIPPDALHPFKKLKSEIEYILSKEGAKFDLLGYIIPIDKKDDILAKLKEKQTSFDQERDALISTYQGLCEKHLQTLHESLTGYAFAQDLIEILKSKQPTIARLKERIRFTILTPRIIDILPEEESIIFEGIQGQLVHDITMKARLDLDKERSTTHISALTNLSKKLKGLSYLNNNYSLVADQLSQIASQVFTPGKPNVDYTTSEKATLTGVLSTLANSAKVEAAFRTGFLFPTQQLFEDSVFSSMAEHSSFEETVDEEIITSETIDSNDDIELEDDPIPADSSKSDTDEVNSSVIIEETTILPAAGLYAF